MRGGIAVSATGGFVRGVMKASDTDDFAGRCGAASRGVVVSATGEVTDTSA
ncbi:MAG: hypothetical protein LBK25_02205 [Treponema sp.]|nr:hypothetical protein [Treponema sp.]